MGTVFAMTLPGVVLALLLAAGILSLARRLGPGSRSYPTAAPGFDVLSELFQPADKHRLNEQHRQELDRDDVEDGAPPRSRVDLAGGTAHLRLPPH